MKTLCLEGRKQMKPGKGEGEEGKKKKKKIGAG
jgi:hypothetical protein